MTLRTLGFRAASRALLVVLCFLAGSLASRSADAIATSPFDALIGRWTGDGILGFKESKPERVKCRATYLLDEASQNELKQTIRCATSSGAIEVISNLKEAAGKLTGTIAGTNVALLAAADDPSTSVTGTDHPEFAIARLQRAPN